MTLLEKMDRRRLKKIQKKDDFHTHECKHCGSLIKLLQKVKVTVKKGDVGGSWHPAHEYIDLEKGCNEEGCVFVHFVQWY